MYQSFGEIAAAFSEDFQSLTWRSGESFRAAWAMINDKSYGSDRVAWRKAMLQWINGVHRLLEEARMPITRTQRVNTMLYKGKHYFSQEHFENLQYNKNKIFDPGKAKIVMNYIGQAVDQHVSDMVSYEPTLTVMPTNDQEQDRVASRMNKHCIDHYWTEWNLITQFQHFHRRKKVHGETFAFVEWDESAGDVHPKYKQYMKMLEDEGRNPSEPVPLLDESGQPIMGDDNQPLFMSQVLKTGDLKFSLEFACRVLYPTPESCLWTDVPYIFRDMWMDIDEVKARWPNSAHLIKPEMLYKDSLGPVNRYITQKVRVRFMYHKPTRYCEKGYYCATTEDAFLEESDYPFNHEHLPCIRGTDIDLDFDIHGMSFIQNLASLNHAINNSTSMILQNQAQFAYPKYASPRGAKVRYTDLGSDRGVYEYSGPVGPQLMVNNSTPQDTWRVIDSMRDSFKTLSQIYATSRGEGVDGITANVALRMIDEQERKLHKPSIDKHSHNVEQLGYIALKTLGTYRDPEDGMLIKIVGKNNERYLKYFDISNLSRSWECKIKRSSGLPDQPAAKTQTVLDLASQFEGMWDYDEVLEYLDIARPERLIESATVARQSAESEVEDILSGVPNVPLPTPYDELLPKYRVYTKAVQSRGFREMHPAIQQRMITQIMTAEYLITKKMKNPAFAEQLLSKHPNFPMVFPEMSAMQPFQLNLAPPPMAMGSESDPLGGISPEQATDAQSGPGPQDMPTPSAAPQPAPVPEGALP